MFEITKLFLETNTRDDLNKMKIYSQKRLDHFEISEKERLIIYEQTMDNRSGAFCRDFCALKHSCVSTL
jgi:hypothetical protein